jgi:hypothetical protein
MPFASATKGLSEGRIRRRICFGTCGIRPTLLGLVIVRLLWWLALPGSSPLLALHIEMQGTNPRGEPPKS